MVRADDAGIRVQARAPEGVADHDAQGTGLVAAPEAGAAHGRPQRLKVVARHLQDAHAFALTVVDEVAPALGVVGEGGHTFERAGLVAQEREVHGGDVVPRAGPARLLLVEADELSRLFEGQRRHQHRLQHAEDGGGRANADGERGDDDGRESRTAPQLPRGIAQILDRLLGPGPAPRRPRVLGDVRDAAEVPPRRRPRLVRRIARVDPVLHVDRQVRGQLVLQILVLLAAAKEISHAAKQRRHDYPSLGRMTRPMALTSRSHFPCSAASCFLPAAVRR